MTLPQLTMRRADLADLPAIESPAGVRIRSATAQDRLGLAECLAQAFRDSTWNIERVDRDLLSTPKVIATIVAIADDTVCATASLAIDPTQHPETGIVHWVARHPAHPIKGLGRQVTLAVLHCAAEQSFKGAFLLTDDDRLAAIRTYLHLGFTPDLSHSSHAARWEAIHHTLA